MKECPHCLTEVFQKAVMQCPFCGGELGPPKWSVSAPRGENSTVGESQQSEAIRILRRQFEERGLELSEVAVARATSAMGADGADWKRICVVVADLSGFARVPDAEEQDGLATLVAEFQRGALQAFTQHGGFPAGVIGDAVVGIFGTPLTYDRDIESAVWAALEIRERFQEVAVGGKTPEIGIGVATGSAGYRILDAGAGRKLSLAGEAFDRALRLRYAAKADEILVCQATHEVIARRFDSELRNAAQVAGRGPEYVAYAILREKRVELERAARPTPLVGREREQSALSQFLLASAAETRTSVVRITGEAGIGKTRLVEDTLARLSLIGGAVFWRASASDGLRLLEPAVRWLHRELGVGPDSNPGTIKLAVDRLLSRRPGHPSDSALMEYLLGLASAKEALKGASPERLQSALLGLFRRLVLDSPHIARPILVIDDAHWLDSLTLGFVEELSTNQRTPSLILILIHRDGESAPLPGIQANMECRLEPLRIEARRTLLKQIVPGEELLPEIQKFLVERASGHPLLLQELGRFVRQLLQNNSELNGEELVNHIIEVIPVSLPELIAARIARLNQRTIEVLQRAALLGLEFGLGLLSMFEELGDELSAQLHAMRGLGYLEELPGERGSKFGFSHSLLREAAYSSLRDDQKQELHGRLGRRLEQAFADRIPEYFELLAFHFGKAGDRERTLYYLAKSGERKSSLGALSSAIDDYQEAIGILQGMPAEPSRQCLMARLLIECARAYRTQGDLPQADELIAGALICARLIANERIGLYARCEEAISAMQMGQIGEAQTSLEDVSREGTRLECPIVQLVALNALGVSRWQQGAHEAALRCFQDLAILAEREGSVSIQADAFNNAGLIYWRWGQYTQALKAFKRAIPLRRRAGDAVGLSATLMNAGIIQEQLGKFIAAKRSYQSALKLAEQTGYFIGLAALESNLSNLERRSGKALVALDHARRALGFAIRAGDPSQEAIACENIALALARCGDTAGAAHYYDRGAELAETLKDDERRLSICLGRLELSLETERPLSDVTYQSIELTIGEIERDNRVDLKPQAYRLRARALEGLAGGSADQAKQSFEMAREIAHKIGNYPEELDCLRSLLALARRHADLEAETRCQDRITQMERVLAEETFV